MLVSPVTGAILSVLYCLLGSSGGNTKLGLIFLVRSLGNMMNAVSVVCLVTPAWAVFLWRS